MHKINTMYRLVRYIPVSLLFFILLMLGMKLLDFRTHQICFVRCLLAYFLPESCQQLADTMELFHLQARAK